VAAVSTRTFTSPIVSEKGLLRAERGLKSPLSASFKLYVGNQMVGAGGLMLKVDV
jgi:hypothetical protein